MTWSATKVFGPQVYMANEIEREERVPKLRRSLAPSATMEPNKAREFLRELRVQAAQDLRRRGEK